MEEKVNHPKHYNLYTIEVIEMMIRIWGLENTKIFCEMNAFKYRMRLGLKDNIEQDIAKEQWYLKKADEIEITLKSLEANELKNNIKSLESK
jgi:hypothetical protein